MDFALLGPEILIKLGEDFVRASPAPKLVTPWPSIERYYASKISEVVSRARISPAGLSSQDATVLAKTFHEVCLRNWVFFPHLLKSLGG